MGYLDVCEWLISRTSYGDDPGIAAFTTSDTMLVSDRKKDMIQLWN